MKKSMIMLSGGIGVSVLVLFAGGWFLFRSPFQENTTTNLIEVPNEDVAANDQPASPLLFVPLHESADARAAFIDEWLERFRAYRFDLRPVYEKYIDQIGANGLTLSVEKERPLCHDEGHDLGRVIYDRIQNVGDALLVCQDACSSGCMHGVLMEFFMEGSPASDHVSLTKVEEKIPEICSIKSFSDIYKPGDCAHGVGHAVMFLSGYHVPTAIQYCDLFDTYPMQYYCATGAYMEYATNRHSRDRDADKSMFYPCDETPYPAACFRYKMVHVLRDWYQAGRTLGALIDQCESLDGKYRLGCFHGLGNAHMPYIVAEKINVATVCSVGTDDDRYVCIEGAMERMAKFYPAQAPERCEGLSDWQLNLCREATERQMYSLTKSFELYER